MAVDRMGYAGRLNLCRALFDVPLIDYGRPTYGLLIGSGAGTMMAIMDASVRFRFALDLDDCRGREHKLFAFIRALDRNGLIELVALAGWFSITDPKPIAAVLKGLSAPVIIYSGAGLGREVFGGLPFVDTLDDFLACAKQVGLTAAPKLHVPEIAQRHAEWAPALRIVPGGHAINRKEDMGAVAAQLRAHDRDVMAPLELAAENSV
jgi:hypothetical protein